MAWGWITQMQHPDPAATAFHPQPQRPSRSGSDKVRRNVVLLCDVTTGRKGRESKALTLTQAMAVITAAAEYRLYAYIVLLLLIDARTEELRALRWCDVDLSRNPDAVPPVPPSICVLRSVRAGGDTKTRRSRPGPRHAATLRRRAQRAMGQAGLRLPRPCRMRMPHLHYPCGNTAGRTECPARLPQGRRKGRARSAHDGHQNPAGDLLVEVEPVHVIDALVTGLFLIRLRVDARAGPALESNGERGKG